MDYPHWRRGLAAAMIVIIASALTAASAPIRQKPGQLPDELIGLAKIEKVTVTAGPLDELLIDAGLTQKRVRKLAVELLVDAGFEVVEDNDEVPNLTYSVEIITSDSLPDIYGYICFVDLYQLVHIPRLERDLVMPTSTLLQHDIRREGGLKEAIEASVEFITEKFIKVERIANEEL